MTQPGAPVISRVAAILRAVGGTGGAGATTTALARSAHIPRATAHRMLTALADQGLIDREPDTGLWYLGPEIFLLGSIATTRYDAAAVAGDILHALAHETGESAFLSARRGQESVCVSAVEGSFPLRSHILYPGRRFPLGVASAGLAILAHMPDADCERHLSDSDLEKSWGSTHSRSAIENRISQTRIDGYSVNPGLIVEGSWGIGAAVFDALNQPQWALSLTGVESRFAGERTDQLGQALLHAAHMLTQRLKHRTEPAPHQT
ncbi:IclR family transcriptional regulator [Mycobacterium sp. Y57]|uniref:IclR family transcriptional regulator n=1 Tax=Mycolicibacterium xanthum TaxID=2796469 RepID=UPI001C8416AD|nr:IclR family transcriptional regulator [Mycolicibacterium xanthum]MBX7431314.1 IclR family transcriptional regulator [Mycolicibacterium xanthum]